MPTTFDFSGWTIFVSVSVSTIATLGLTYILRIAGAAAIEGKIKNHFDEKILHLKDQLDVNQQKNIISLENRFKKEAAAHATVLAAFAEGRKAAMEKRTESVAKLWSAVARLGASVPAGIRVLDAMTIDDLVAVRTNDQVSKLLAKDLDQEVIKAVLSPEINAVRPFVGQDLWLKFDCYRTIVVRRLFLFTFANTDKQMIEWFKDTTVDGELLKAILTDKELEEFLELRFNQWVWLTRVMEAKIVAAAEDVISGRESGRMSAVEVAKLSALVEKAIAPVKDF